MITINGTELRNAMEQIEKNKQDIAKHYAIDRVLADFGIKIIGRIDSASELPDPATFTGDYGDAYAVGESEPFQFYIWTRPDPNAGEHSSYWLDIGPLAIVGPEGPEGPEGAQGPKGEATVIHNGTSAPARNSAVKNVPNGDYYINTTTGDLYKKANNTWTKISSLKGPQGDIGPAGATGPQGPRGTTGPMGPQGPAGQSVEIIGIVSTNMQLPVPTTVPRTAAYLVGSTGNYTLYAVTGTGTNLAWDNLGPFNTGTQVTVNGEPVSVLNADDYLKAPSNFNTKNYVVLARYDNALGTMAYGQNATNGLLVQRTVNGAIRVPDHWAYLPANNEAVSAGYVQDAISGLEDKVLTSPQRSSQKVILNASSNNPRNLSSLCMSNAIWINSAELLIYFPSEQGYIQFGRSDATDSESDIQFNYHWYSTTNCKYAYISITYDYENDEQLLTFRSGDGKETYTETFTGNISIDYLLWDSVSGTSVNYIEEIKFYQARTSINPEDISNMFNYPN